MVFFHQLVFRYFDLYFLLFKTNKSDMKTTQKMVNNLINENIFAFKVSSLRQDGGYSCLDIWG